MLLFDVYEDSNNLYSSLSCPIFGRTEEDDDELPIECVDDKVVEDRLRDGLTKVGIAIQH